MKRGFGFFIVVINRPIFVVFACHRVHIQEMASATVKMVSESVKSFVDSDELLAQKVIASDGADLD